MDPREYIPDFTWPAGTDAVDFQVAGREDGEEINALFNRSFEQQRSAAHYAWKYWDGPGGAPHGVIAVEKEGGKVLAISTGVAKKVWLDGRERRTLLLCETSSDPAARGGGKGDGIRSQHRACAHDQRHAAVDAVFGELRQLDTFSHCLGIQTNKMRDLVLQQHKQIIKEI